MKGFQMEKWYRSEGCWAPMQNGSAPRTWRPRATAREAITKCCEWTGWMFIPAMQVRELTTGKVIWRRGDPLMKAQADIEHPDEPRPPWMEQPSADVPVEHEQDALL